MYNIFHIISLLELMKRNHLSYLFSAILSIFALASCIEDGFTSSPTDQPVFSVDTLDIGTIFTEQVSTTHRFTVYNRADKSLNISHISISGDNASLFRLNVDGFSGREFSNVEIRANDSILVFVETTLPANGQNVPVQLTASLDFLTNGVARSVVLSATGRDVVRLRATTINEDTILEASKPYQIFDSLVVAAGATLTLPAGTEMFFHDAASFIVHGTLLVQGEVGREVSICGDRTGFVAADISFDLMSRQWGGLRFTPSSTDNELHYLHLCNTTRGVVAEGSPDSPTSLLMVNSRLRNSAGYALEVHNVNLSAYGCEIAEAGSGALLLDGGKHTINQCTLSNYYLFSVIGGAILQFATDDNGTLTPSAEISNTIIYGLGTDVSHGDLSGSSIFLRRCLLKSDGTDDDNFINCMWNTDPKFRTIREDYYFDYRLQAESEAIDAGDPQLVLPLATTDRYGLERGSMPDLGAYVYTPDSQQ